MNSRLYRCKVMHHRIAPKQHKFAYHYFMFYLDLDELTTIQRKIALISRNRFNVFNFREKDHFQLAPDHRSLKEQVLLYCGQKGVETDRIQKVMLLTNLRTFGYQFNPVSFYYCFDKNDNPICCIPEIGNTYGEIKLFMLAEDTVEKDIFVQRTTKYFYVSPFMDMNTDFHFQLSLPDKSLNLRIDDYKDGKRIFMSQLSGVKRELTNFSVIYHALRFPLVTVKIIALIHWQALLLWLKKISYHKKASFIDMQKQVLKPHKSLIK